MGLFFDHWRGHDTKSRELSLLGEAYAEALGFSVGEVTTFDVVSYWKEALDLFLEIEEVTAFDVVSCWNEALDLFLETEEVTTFDVVRS